MPIQSEIITLKSRIQMWERNLQVYDNNITAHTSFINRERTKASRSKDVNFKTHVASLIRARQDAININKQKKTDTTQRIYKAKARIKELSYR